MLGYIPRFLLVAVLIFGSGCFPDAEGTTIDTKQTYFYYPIGLGISSNGNYLVVANSNFDLLYNSGSVVPVDLSHVGPYIDHCRKGASFPETNPGCSEFIVPIEEHIRDENTYQVNDAFVLVDHSVLIGSYASTLHVLDVTPDQDSGSENSDFVLVPVRSDASLHYIDLNETPQNGERVLRCRSTVNSWSVDTGVQSCGSDRRIRSGRNPTNQSVIGLPSEPFSIQSWYDGEEESFYVVVGHMTSTYLSLFKHNSSSESEPLSLIDVDDSFLEGTSGIIVHGDGRFLATSREASSINSFRVITDQLSFVRNIPVDAADPGADQRGIALSPDGNTAFIVSREPESVLFLDVTLDHEGQYEDEFVDVVEVGVKPSIILVHEDSSADEGYLVYIVSFEEDRIFVLDPAAREIVDVIQTRRGPHSLVFDEDRGVAYIANFLESTVSILDVRSGSPTRHTILTTLGVPRRPRTND